MWILQILISLVSSFRYDIQVVDSATANSEAATLYEAIKRNALDNDDFTLILSHRNNFQLRETFKCYKQNYGSSIDEARSSVTASLHNYIAASWFSLLFIIFNLLQDILNCGKDSLGHILKVVIWCIDFPEKHFAWVRQNLCCSVLYLKDICSLLDHIFVHPCQVIRTSIDGLGTDEDSLTRVIVTRAEIDMMKVKEEYFKQNNGCLDKAVAFDTSGNYKDFLMILLGAN